MIGEVLTMRKIALYGMKLVKVGSVLVDNDDYDKVAGKKWFLSKSGGYAVASHRHQPKAARMHRLIMDAPDGLLVDHKNGNRLDNRRTNLRLVDATGNACNRAGPSPNGTSGHRGVYYHKPSRMWMAKCVFRGKQHVVYFKTKEEAVQYAPVLRREVMGDLSPRS